MGEPSGPNGIPAEPLEAGRAGGSSGGRNRGLESSWRVARTWEPLKSRKVLAVLAQAWRPSLISSGGSGRGVGTKDWAAINTPHTGCHSKGLLWILCKRREDGNLLEMALS